MSEAKSVLHTDMVSRADAQSWVDHAVGKEQKQYRSLFAEWERVTADRDANIAAWERVLGRRSEGEAKSYIDGLLAERDKYLAALEAICVAGRNPTAETALNARPQCPHCNLINGFHEEWCSVLHESDSMSETERV